MHQAHCPAAASLTNYRVEKPAKLNVGLDAYHRAGRKQTLWPPLKCRLAQLHVRARARERGAPETNGAISLT
jgi:hypothetical protein